MQLCSSAMTAEALKLSIPATVHSRSTEAHNQDKVSTGTIAARDARTIAKITEAVAAIDLIAAAQALEIRGVSRAGRSGKRSDDSSAPTSPTSTATAPWRATSPKPSPSHAPTKSANWQSCTEAEADRQKEARMARQAPWRVHTRLGPSGRRSGEDGSNVALSDRGEEIADVELQQLRNRPARA